MISLESKHSRMKMRALGVLVGFEFQFKFWPKVPTIVGTESFQANSEY